MGELGEVGYEGRGAGDMVAVVSYLCQNDGRRAECGQDADNAADHYTQTRTGSPVWDRPTLKRSVRMRRESLGDDSRGRGSCLTLSEVKTYTAASAYPTSQFDRGAVHCLSLIHI